MRVGHLWAWIWIEAGKVLGSIAIDWNCSIKISLFLGQKQLHELLSRSGYHTFLYAPRCAVFINSDVYCLPSSISKVTPYSCKRQPITGLQSTSKSEMLP